MGSTEPGAILVPQRAVTDLLYKHYVYVVNADNSVSMKEVQLDARIGRLWLVKSGLDGTETVVVEGVQKLNKDSKVDPVTMTEDELDTSSDSSSAGSAS